MYHTLVALVEDKPGVLNRISSLFRRRAYNIESLTVSQTEKEGISRMTIVVQGEETQIERLIAYLYKRHCRGKRWHLRCFACSTLPNLVA